jgi:cytochrome c biogenesis protein CcdA
MLLIGGIFIFFSGFIYFVIMVLLLFFFSALDKQSIIAIIAGIIAVIFGGLNIKDFFFFKRGPSASIPESQKPKLYKQMRKVIKITSLPALIGATILLAITANTVELACTLVLPVVYIGVLKSFALGNIENIIYLIIYNIIYIIPLLIFTLAVVITLGRWKLSEWQGRILKLFSGIMMLSLGVVLLYEPEILKNFLITIVILIISIVISIIISYTWRKLHSKETGENTNNK